MYILHNILNVKKNFNLRKFSCFLLNFVFVSWLQESVQDRRHKKNSYYVYGVYGIVRFVTLNQYNNFNTSIWEPTLGRGAHLAHVVCDVTVDNTVIVIGLNFFFFNSTRKCLLAGRGSVGNVLDTPRRRQIYPVLVKQPSTTYAYTV